MKAWGLLAPLLAVILAAGAAAEGFGDIKLPKDKGGPPVPAKPVASNAVCSALGLPVGGTVAPPDSKGRFCTDIASCKSWCCQACDYHPDRVNVNAKGDKTSNDDSATCARAPYTGFGMIDPADKDLKNLGDRLHDIKVLTGYRGKISTKATADGLQALDTFLQGWEKRREHPFNVLVRNCYRRAIGNQVKPTANDGNAETVCGWVFEFVKNEGKPAATPKGNAADEEAINKTVWGLAWPGNTPHSDGSACDLVMIDGQGRPCFDWRAGEANSPKCEIEGLDQKAEVQLLTEAVAAVGGKRLDYEAWHFEWGGRPNCRCQGADCDDIWPLTPAAGCPK